LHKGVRDSVYGQGELKQKGWDQLFSINHSLAMFGDKMSRLSRRSWNLTKKIECLDHHMMVWKHRWITFLIFH